MRTKLIIGMLILLLIATASAYTDTSYDSFNLAFSIDGGGNNSLSHNNNHYSVEQIAVADYDSYINTMRLAVQPEAVSEGGGASGGGGGYGWTSLASFSNATGVANVTKTIITQAQKPKNYVWLFFVLALVMIARAVKIQKRRRRKHEEDNEDTGTKNNIRL